MARISSLCLILFLSVFVSLPSLADELRTIPASSLNAVIVSAIKTMPAEGKYAATAVAQQSLASAISRIPSGLSIDTERACPSFCSSATYLVFARAIQQLIHIDALKLDKNTLDALLVHGQRDGEGAWGRWNANGPGTARLFSELDLGPNFTSFDRALPGDFMKIFWSSEIGAREYGHSVIYLGNEIVEGVEHVRFWSSSKTTNGYGIKTVPKLKIARAVFSRLEKPANLSRLSAIPVIDSYLASLLKVRSSPEQMAEKCDISDKPAKIGPGSR